MEKFIILMWLCSATTSTPLNCQQLKTDRVKFVDQYSCTVYGYTHSLRVIRDLASILGPILTPLGFPMPLTNST